MVNASKYKMVDIIDLLDANLIVNSYLALNVAILLCQNGY
jgi:hypothetical protein